MANNNIKSKYKTKLNSMNKKQLELESREVRMELMKARSLVSIGANPYHQGEYNIKLMKWKLSQLKVAGLMKDTLKLTPSGTKQNGK